MGYFDDVISRTKSMAEVVGKKSAEALEISKKKIELIDCNNKLSKAYAALGKVHFDEICGATASEEDVSKLVSEIEQLVIKVSGLEEDIQVILDSKPCPACGADIKNNSAFCSRCGADIR